MANVPRAIRRRTYTPTAPTRDFKPVRSYVVPKHLLDDALAWLQSNCKHGSTTWLSASGASARSDGGGYADFANAADADAFAVWMRERGEEPLTSDQKNGFAPMPGTKAN